MSTMFDPTGRSHAQRNLKWTATGVAALLVVGAGVLGYVAWSATHHATGTTSAAQMAADSTPTLRIGTVAGAATAPVDTPIQLSGADGLGSASLTLTYDPAVVSVLSVRNGNVPESQLTWRHDATQGTLVLLVTTALSKGATGESALAYVTLKAVDGAVGKISPLNLAVRSAVLASGETITVGSASGSFHNGVPGDVTGNGIVDKDDYERLASYLVGENVPIVALNADLDGDGKVTDADAIKLHQFLAAGEGAQ